ncbi:malate synthase, glyoxysomal-like [Amblyraja radiata]|uniref:malate synthase, glyoxysomal-like n=1 Tax=Amblyraja radiata TaxID=386614 RepID=UPI001401DEBD|nr:malate synthase, glyoxysomal-like [Amblyraja radiata]
MAATAQQITLSTGVELEPPPAILKVEFQTILTPETVQFLAELVSTFDEDVEEILQLRIGKKLCLDRNGGLPEFLPHTSHIREDQSWKVQPVPQRLQNRHVDLGDVSPANTEHFITALSSTAQGIQTDFDDGHCPTYLNQIQGLFNVYKAVHSQFPDIPHISKVPILMLRPRAWNMVEHNMLVHGKEVPGPLFDFGLLMYHCGRILFENGCGPFFYLSKVESHLEARLWNKIFVWVQKKLGLPNGSIKATVLIENILAAFEMEEILYELRDHSAGLNCGIWDYSASFVNKFGHRREFLLPDRSKYVNIEKMFLKSYMDLLIKTCHKRGALATGGMAALLLPRDKEGLDYQSVLAKVRRLKLLEINAGVDGFMVFDLDLIKPMTKLFLEHTDGPNQLHVLREDVDVTPSDLLTMPSGGVTLHGLKYNIGVGILFIEAWLRGQGTFYFRGQVEDSATAEISRSQVWQWLRHRVKLENDGRIVTRNLVQALVKEIETELQDVLHHHNDSSKGQLAVASEIFLEIVQKRDFPEFLTMYLNLEHTFLSANH